MFLCEVVGHLWGAKQAPGLAGLKLLRVRPVRLRGGTAEVGRVDVDALELSEKELIAADTLGAGSGEYVLVATGSRVRDIVYDTRTPIKALVVAIVDGADIELGEVR